MLFFLVEFVCLIPFYLNKRCLQRYNELSISANSCFTLTLCVVAKRWRNATCAAVGSPSPVNGLLISLFRILAVRDVCTMRLLSHFRMIETVTTYFLSLHPAWQILVAHLAAVLFACLYYYFVPHFTRQGCVWIFGKHINFCISTFLHFFLSQYIFLCSVFCVLCSVFCVLLSFVLCPLSCVLCSLFFVPFNNLFGVVLSSSYCSPRFDILLSCFLS